MEVFPGDLAALSFAAILIVMVDISGHEYNFFHGPRVKMPQCCCDERERRDLLQDAGVTILCAP